MNAAIYCSTTTSEQKADNLSQIQPQMFTQWECHSIGQRHGPIMTQNESLMNIHILLERHRMQVRQNNRPMNNVDLQHGDRLNEWE